MMSNEDKTLSDVVRDVWRAKMYIFVVAVLGVIAAGLWVRAATPYYRATMIISPASPMNGADISSLLSEDKLFALSFLAQRMGVANSSDFLRFESIYAGPSVAAALLDNPHIKRGLVLDKPFSFMEAQEDWSAESLAAYIEDHVDLEPVGGTSLRRLVYLHPHRKFASYFLHRLHGATDALIRQNIREETEDRIAYLKDAANATLNPTHRRAMTSLLLEQERLRMLVSIDQPYAAAIIEPPSTGLKPHWPDPQFLYAVFALVGAFVGFVIHNFRQEFKQDVQPQARQENIGQKAISMQKAGWLFSDSQNSNTKEKERVFPSKSTRRTDDGEKRKQQYPL